MRDDITRSDGVANGMLIASAASYPLVRGAARMVGGAMDAASRNALVDKGATLTTYAAEMIPLVRSHLEVIDRMLQELGIERLRGAVQAAMPQLEERVRWFSPTNIRDFVEANPVAPGHLYNELGEFLATPIRALVDAIRTESGMRDVRTLNVHVLELERALIRFAAEKFDADISRPNEPSYLLRSWLVKWGRIAAIVLAGIAGALAIAWFSI